MHAAPTPGRPPATGASAALTVVVINHNTCEDLRTCLTSVVQEAPDEIVVVDNASTDASAEMVRAEFPDVVLLANEQNAGYGPAANQAVACSRSPYVLLLNSDAHPGPGALRRLSAYLDRHPRVAIVGPRVLSPDGSVQPSCFPFPGTWAWFCENDPVGWAAGRVPWLRRRLLRYNPPGQAQAVPWILGAALAIRRAAFDAVEGFDESFFMYYEEVDLCYRLRKRGWETHHLPEAVIYHAGGASTSKQRVSMLVQRYASTICFYRKHYTGVRLRTWVFLLRTKMWSKLLRDRLRLYLIHDAGARRKLEEDVVAWRRALRERGERTHVRATQTASHPV